jgi:hypothetical protein
MSEMINTLLRTVILDDSAYQEWRERPNLLLRGLILIAIITLVAEVIVFAADLVYRVSPVDMAQIEDQIRQGFEMQEQFNPGMQNMPPELRAQMDKMIDTIVPMVGDIMKIEAPLPRGISGFFQALGAYLTRVLAAWGGWMLYGALVLIAVNLLGGSVKLPDFLGMTSLYIIPGLLAVLQLSQPALCCCGGTFLALIGTIWAIVVYVKAVSVASGLDAGRSIVAVLAPFITIFLLSVLLAILAGIWMSIAFS